MGTHLGKKQTPEQWGRAKVVAEGYLISAAQARRLVTYKELDAALVAATGRRMAPSGWSQFLGELVTETHDKHGVMLSALIVHAGDLRPGKGFVDLAKEKGWVSADLPAAAAIEQLRGQLFRKFATA